jgi:predicted transcriptional regulator
MSRPPVMKLDRVDQYKVLINPVRFEMFECMRALAPCTAAELARQMARAPDTLYPHLRKLIRIGVVVEAGRRKRGRHHETLFDLAADDVAFSHLRGETAQRVFAMLGEMFLRVARRSLQAALRQRLVQVTSDDRRNLIITSYFARLDENQFEEVRKLTRQILEILTAARSRSSGELYQCLNMVCPVRRKPRRRD